ncbi:PH domain-containing protein [Flavonifractor plautii]|uniref:PH domain-containing protein n=1 Tax=Flavonifractor plautii TaxID=292800 RepID=UPI001DCC0398|nr:PH domain-containing protein [Flavonifractor plautii]MBM6664257.1 PH domain-containing protein [Flavonifractor plautii]
MAQLKTADQMLAYCKEHRTTAGTTLNKNKKHFEVIANSLEPGEYALSAFTGLMDYFNWAFVITNNRIIIGQKKLVGQFIKSVYLDKLNDITVTAGPIHGFIEIDTLKEKFKFCVDNKNVDNINSIIHWSIEKQKEYATAKGENSSNQSSLADEILKFKHLLDIGAITQEEFDEKKRRLLEL